MDALQKLKNATRMLAEIRTADDAKQVMDIASAAEHYATKHKLGELAIGHSHAIKTEAGAILGEFIEQDVKPGRRWSNCSNGEQLENHDLPEGVTRKDSIALRFLAMLRRKMPEEFLRIKNRDKTLTQVRREWTKAQALSDLQAFPSSQFRILYADPPWKYGDTLAGDISENYGGAEKHYPAMTIDELCDLPVKAITEENAVLFLWVTSPLLFESEAVFKAWGFQYKSAFIWDKVKHNMGHYNSVRHELLLICTQGSCTPDVNILHDSVQSIERSDTHSEKPEEFREIIDSLYPYGRRVELFARREVPAHWERWGSQLLEVVEI